jgi:hypothetical protein
MAGASLSSSVLGHFAAVRIGESGPAASKSSLAAICAALPSSRWSRHAFIAISSQPVSPALTPHSWRANPIVDSERWFGFDLFCAFEYVHLS